MVIALDQSERFGAVLATQKGTFIIVLQVPLLSKLYRFQLNVLTSGQFRLCGVIFLSE